MPLVSVRVNKKSIERKISNSSAAIRKTKSVISSRIEAPLRSANEALLREFLTNEITREILEGPDAPNISGTLGGRGNLFSFIGFEDGSDPIAPIINVITNSIKVKSIRKASSSELLLQITITVPSKEEIFEVTPLPWAVGKSWAEGIERGMSGLGYYLYKEKGFSNSRSGKAIQLKSKIGIGGFSNKKYISALLNDISVYITQEIKNSFR